jgi:hypothetical protein
MVIHLPRETRPGPVTLACTLLYVFAAVHAGLGVMAIVSASASAGLYLLLYLAIGVVGVILAVLAARVVQGIQWARILTWIAVGFGAAWYGQVLILAQNERAFGMRAAMFVGLLAVAVLLATPSANRYFRHQ